MSKIKTYYFDVDNEEQNRNLDLIGFLIETNREIAKNFLEPTPKKVYNGSIEDKESGDTK